MNSDKEHGLLNEVADYYSSKLFEHGETASGVDWNGEDSQLLRFEQLSKIINTATPFSINDLGCGYGAFYEFIAKRYVLNMYTGIDISTDMVQAAENRFQGNSTAKFVVSSRPKIMADFGIASGIFNVRLGRTDKEWRAYLESTLDVLANTSRLGFSFNCLTSFSDTEKMRDYLYYADSCELFQLCKKRYSRNVALLHDYDLYEFTILVRKH